MANSNRPAPSSRSPSADSIFEWEFASRGIHVVIYTFLFNNSPKADVVLFCPAGSRSDPVFVLQLYRAFDSGNSKQRWAVLVPKLFEEFPDSLYRKAIWLFRSRCPLFCPIGACGTIRNLVLPASTILEKRKQGNAGSADWWSRLPVFHYLSRCLQNDGLLSYTGRNLYGLCRESLGSNPTLFAPVQPQMETSTILLLRSTVCRVQHHLDPGEMKKRPRNRATTTWTFVSSPNLFNMLPINNTTSTTTLYRTCLPCVPSLGSP